MTPLISMLRIYMGALATKARLARWYKVFPFLMAYGLISYSIWPAYLQLAELKEASSGISFCMSQQRPNSMAPIKSWLASYVLLCIAIGLFCDSSLYHIIKSRQRVHPSQDGGVVPWYSSNQVPMDDLQIPIKATQISIGLLVMFAGLLPGVLVGAYVHLLDLFFDVALLLANVIPILIMFVGVKNKAKIQQAPARLQFHEDVELQQGHA